ncbi:hypothetical protein, partial [Klebsiella sp. S69]|uniref:hypothetical protein n=1 Tax=Klebsiella sp. S69 TaxID=2767439 RepID=UPI0039B756DE
MLLKNIISVVIIYLFSHSVFSFDKIPAQGKMEKISYFSVGMNGGSVALRSRQITCCFFAM